MKALIVYADESGTHDQTGNQQGSQHPVIAGFAAPPSEWSKFCVEWKAVLDAYGAPYFHFREWADASALIRFNRQPSSDSKKNPFYGWDLKQLDKFLITLAKVAARGNKAIIAGSIKLLAFNRLKAKLALNNPENLELDPYPYKYCMGEFFNVYHRETFRRWGKFNCPVSFFFDQNDNPKWAAAVAEVFGAFKKKDLRMKEVSFADKLQRPHWPLQAADMLAYRIRQLVQNISDERMVLQELDDILLNNLIRSGDLAVE